MVCRCMLCFQAAKDAGVDQNDLEAWNVREKSDAELIARFDTDPDLKQRATEQWRKGRQQAAKA